MVERSQSREPEKLPIFTEEDENLIKLINRHIALADQKSYFMKDLQKYIRVFEKTSPPRFRKRKHEEEL